MAVVKNLMVRFGSDVSNLIRGMKTAKTSTADSAASIKKSTSGMRKSVKEAFSDSRMSVREYSAYVAKTRQDHTVAVQGAQKLTDQIRQMEGVYRKVKTATAGLDLSKPLTDQIRLAENELVKIEGKARRLEQELAGLENSTGRGSPKRMQTIRGELEELAQKSRNAQRWLIRLNQVAGQLGSKRIRFASDAGLKSLAADIHRAKNELNALELTAAKTGGRLRAMGVAPTLKYTLKTIGTTAAQAVSGGVRRLGSSLKSMGAGALRGIASIPARLRGIGRSAEAGTWGLTRMVRSIRNLGIASLGMRVATGMFGTLRGVISSYISQNEALNASVTSMKNQLGQALTPAINMVIAAMQRLMPVVTAVSNGINSVFSALFGDIKTTTAAVAQSAKSLELYGFDQITKASDDSDTSGSTESTPVPHQTGAQNPLVSKLTGWIGELKSAFASGDWAGLGSILGGGINQALDAIDAVDAGSRAGAFANNVFTTLHSALSTTDFSGIGEKLGQMLSAGLETFDGRKAGETVGKALTALPSIVVGFIEKTDWSQVATSVSGFLTGALSSVGDWIRGVDWLKLGDSLWQLVTGINYGQIATSLFRLLGSALGAGVGVIWGFIGNAVQSIRDYFTKKIQEAGGNVALGLLKGIWDGLKGIVTWIREHIFQPFIDGFKKVFGIHSPSTVMQEQGDFLIQGLLGGMSRAWANVITFISEGLSSIGNKLSESWSKFRSQAGEKWGAITTTVSGKMEQMRSNTAEKLRLIRTAASDAWENCRSNTALRWSEISGTMSDKLAGMKTAASEKFQNIGKNCAEAWNGMQTNIAAAVSQIAGRAGAGFENMKKGVVDTFAGLWSGVKGWINRLIGGVESMVNFVIWGVNRMIDSFNRIASVGDSFGLDLSIRRIAEVSLPRLATGGIATGATAALIGEAGREAVLPLDRNDGWKAELARELTQLQGSESGASITIPIYLGSRKVTEFVIRDINRITKTTGVCPIYV